MTVHQGVFVLLHFNGSRLRLNRGVLALVVLLSLITGVTSPPPASAVITVWTQVTANVGVNPPTTTQVIGGVTVTVSTTETSTPMSSLTNAAYATTYRPVVSGYPINAPTSVTWSFSSAIRDIRLSYAYLEPTDPEVFQYSTDGTTFAAIEWTNASAAHEGMEGVVQASLDANGYVRPTAVNAGGYITLQFPSAVKAIRASSTDEYKVGGTAANAVNNVGLWLAPPSAPAAPTSTAVGSGTVSLAWVAPAANGSAIDGYNVQVATAADGTFTDATGCTSLAGTALSCTATGLTNGTPYYFKVMANSTAGPSSYSPASNAFTPVAAPAAPAAPTSTAVGSGTVSLAWVAPAANGSAIDGYNVQVATAADGTFTDATGCTSLAGTALSCTATGLTNGTAYYFKVRAKNGVGDGGYSPASNAFTPVAAPAAPAAPTSTAVGSGTVSLAWVAPAANGSAIDGYNVQVATAASGTYADASGCTSLAGTALSCTATGLTNGTAYYFKVRAKNGVGGGGYSPASNAFTPVAGGGGDSSAEATPTPTPTAAPASSQAPAATTPDLGPVLPGTNPNVPAVGMPLGSSVLLVDGQSAPVTITPNAPRNPSGLVAAGDGFTLQLAGRGTDGKSLGLARDGSLILQRDGRVAVQGTGFQPNTEVRLYLFSEPRLLGTVTTDASGALIGAVPMSVSLAAGRHTLQANGLEPDGSVRSLSLGVQVNSPTSKATTRTKRVTVTFVAGSAWLSPSAKKSLRALAAGRARTATRTVVAGYVQDSDNRSSDKALSVQRARAVAAYLKELGVKGAIVARGNRVAKQSGAAGRKASVTLTYRA